MSDDALTVECDCGERTTDPTPCVLYEIEHCRECLSNCDHCAAAFWTDLDVDCARDEERNR